MAQTIPNPVTFGDAEAARLNAFRASLLARHGEPEPEDDGDHDRLPLTGPTILAVIAACVVVFGLLALSTVEWAR